MLKITKDNTVPLFSIWISVSWILPYPLISYHPFSHPFSLLLWAVFYFASVANVGRLLSCMFCSNPFAMYRNSIN